MLRPNSVISLQIITHQKRVFGACACCSWQDMAQGQSALPSLPHLRCTARRAAQGMASRCWNSPAALSSSTIWDLLNRALLDEWVQVRGDAPFWPMAACKTALHGSSCRPNPSLNAHSKDKEASLPAFNSS